MADLVELLVWDYGEAVATALGLALVLSITRIVRAGRARRRHEAVPYDPTVRIPVRIRGGDPAYPGIFRLGWLDQITVRWRPGLRWGAPVSLAGAEIHGRTDARLHDTLPRFVREDTDAVLHCRDGRGSRLDLVVHEHDVPAVTKCLARSTAGRPGPGSTTRWSRIQTAVPPSAVVYLLAGVAWLILLIPVGSLAVAVAATHWAFAAVVVANQMWHRRRLARTTDPPVHRVRVT